MHPSANRSDMIHPDKMREVLHDLAMMDVRAVTFSGGGEPLTYPWIKDSMKFCLNNGIDLSIITNGVLLSGSRASILSNAKWVRISADYTDKWQYQTFRNVSYMGFDRVCKNIKKFSKNKNVDLGINFIVHKQNCKDVFKAAKLFKSLGCNNIRFCPVWYPNFFSYHKKVTPIFFKGYARAKKLLEDKKFSISESFSKELSGGCLEQRTYTKCPMMQILPVIASDSNVYTCHNKAYDPKGLIGSIKKQSFMKLWDSKQTKKFMKNFNPSCSCKHQCTNDAKNLLINEILEAEGNFI
jgi:MoaA/NifB/PqqE/SkfB family radical SAM enzyme